MRMYWPKHFFLNYWCMQFMFFSYNNLSLEKYVQRIWIWLWNTCSVIIKKQFTETFLSYHSHLKTSGPTTSPLRKILWSINLKCSSIDFTISENSNLICLTFEWVQGLPCRSILRLDLEKKNRNGLTPQGFIIKVHPQKQKKRRN